MTRKAEANAATAPPSAARLGGWLDFSNWSDAAAMGFLILAATLPYLNALFNGFVYVDSSQILNDPYVRSFRYLPEILTTTVWSQVGTITASNYYRPLMTLGYLGCYSLFGELPFGFHLFSVIVNTANVCLLFKLSERMLKDRALAFVAALVFALHPIHTEAVAWNAAVPDLDVTFFFLLSAFWFFLGLGQPGDGHFESGHLGMMLSYLGAILSKEPSLLFPLVVTGYEHFYRDDRALTTWKQKLSRYRGIGLLALLYVVFRIWLFGAFAPRLSQLHLTRPQVILTGISLAGEYLWKLLWPAQLSAFYVFHRTGNVIGPRVIGGIGGLLLFGALFLLLRRRGELASFGFVWILPTLAPVLNAPWMGGSVFGERYLYLPSVGFAWLAAWAGVSLWRKAWRYGLRWQRSLAAAALAVAMLCGIRIVARNGVWENDEVLYNSVLAVFPDAYSIRTNLGMVYWQRGHLDAAEREWRRALRQQPDYTQALAGLGLIYLSKGRFRDAETTFRRMLQMDPGNARAYLYLGNLYLDYGLRERAQLEYLTVITISPLSVEARNRLGEIYMSEGRVSRAEEQFSISLRCLPNVAAYDALAEIYSRRGSYAEAEDALRRALSMDPYYSHSHFQLGGIYARNGRDGEAAKEYEEGLKTEPNNQAIAIALQDVKSRLPNEKPQKP